MKAPIIFVLPDNELLGQLIIAGINGEKGNYILRQFPDGETYLRILNEVSGREIIVLCSLN